MRRSKPALWLLVIFSSWVMVWCFTSKNVLAQNGRDCEITSELLPGNQIELAPEMEPDPAGGVFLGLGDVARGGDYIKVEAAFPLFVGAGGHPAAVNIYLMVQLPGGYLYFLKPDGRFSPGIGAWRKGVDCPIRETIIPPLPLVNPITGESILPPGTFIFSTLVVEGEKSEDLSDLDWDHDPMNICFYALEIFSCWDNP